MNTNDIKPIGPLYDIHHDHEIDTLLGHARELQPGKPYRFRVFNYDEARFRVVESRLPKGVTFTFTITTSPFKGEELHCAFHRDAHNTTPVAIESAPKPWLPGARLPAFLRRWLRDLKVEWNRRQQVRSNRRVERLNQKFKATLARRDKACDVLEKAVQKLTLIPTGYAHTRTGLGPYWPTVEVETVWACTYTIGPDSRTYKVTAFETGGVVITLVS